MKKGSLHIDMMTLMILAVLILMVLIVLVITGVQQPGADLARQAALRTCCQAGMPITCEDPTKVECAFAANMNICTTSPCKLDQAAKNLKITDVKKFCGCG